VELDTWYKQVMKETMYLLCRYIAGLGSLKLQYSNVIVNRPISLIPLACSRILHIASLTDHGCSGARDERGMGGVRLNTRDWGGGQRACAMHMAYMNGSSYYTRSSLNRFRKSVLHLLPNLLSGTPLALDTDLADISNSYPSAVVRRARPRKLTSIPPSKNLTLGQRLIFLRLPTSLFLFTLPIPIPTSSSPTPF
jgi:hypothetical protein